MSPCLPFFGSAVVSLLLFMVGGVVTGMEIAGSGRFPRWTGWAYAIATTGFMLSNFILPVWQSIFWPLLFLATVIVAWKAGQED